MKRVRAPQLSKRYFVFVVCMCVSVRLTNIMCVCVCECLLTASACDAKHKLGHALISVYIKPH